MIGGGLVIVLDIINGVLEVVKFFFFDVCNVVGVVCFKVGLIFDVI